MMPETGCPTDAGVLAEAGFDAMRLRADCTTEACDPKMLSEVEAAFQQNGMIPIRMANEGEPGVIEVQGVRFGFVAVEGEEMDEDNLRAGIANARGVAEVVIVLPAWGAGTDPFPDPDQLALAQVAADAGADLIIGSHTQIQAFGEVEGVPVFFGLGNFTGAEAERGLMVRVYFRGGEYLGFELFPTFTDAEGVHLTGPEETAEILEGLEEINPGLP
jgi:poly-gamma-glutamate capsule biosynthesis protein CapA/YwtB (metallophosphatase superfamily)